MGMVFIVKADDEEGGGLLQIFFGYGLRKKVPPYVPSTVIHYGNIQALMSLH